MATFCIPKAKIEKLKSVFKGLSDKNQLETLVKLSPEKRISAFSQQLTKEEAELLNRELERALANEKVSALKNWLRNNLDEKYREKKISQNQRASIRAFIESRLYPAKMTSEIVPMAEIKNMSDKELTELLGKTYKREEISKMKELIDKAVAKDKEIVASQKAAKKTLSEGERRANIQRSVIERFISGNKKKPTRVAVPMAEILKMSPEKQLDFLKKVMPEKEAKESVEKIQGVSKSKLEKEIDDKLRNFKSMKDFDKFIESRIDRFVSMKEGVALTDNEVDNVFNLTADVRSKKELLDKNPLDKSAQFEYGKTQVALREYLTNLRGEGEKTLEEHIMNIIGIQRALQLGVDFSISTIQLAGAITEKSTWKAIAQGFKNAMSKEEQLAMKARIMGDPLFKDAEKSGLRLSLFGTELFKKEEAAMFNKFKNNGGNKIVGGINETLGFFERYTSLLTQARFDLFKQMVEATKAAERNVDIATKEGKKELEDIATAINRITGSPNLGRAEKYVPAANTLMMAARLFVGKFQNLLLTPIEAIEHYSKKAIGKSTRMSDIVMEKKMRATAGIVGVSSSLMAAAALAGYDVDTNPKSNKFGTAKVGDRYVDLTLGYGSYIKFITQILTGEKKNAETGVVSQIRDLSPEEEAAGEIRARGKGGAEIGVGDVTADFMRGKLASVPGAILDFYLGETFIGDKPTGTQQLRDRVPPMFLSDLWNIWQNEKSSAIEDGFLSIIAAGGIGGHTIKPEDWNKRDTKEMKQFIEENGVEKAKEAGKEYSSIVRKRIEELKNSDDYKKKTNKQKSAEMTSLKKEVKQEVFDKYGFVYVRDEE